MLSLFTSNVDSEVAAYDSQVAFKVEGRKILTDAGTCRITYIGRVTDTEQYDSLLSSTIAHRLASEIAYAVTGSNSVVGVMQQMYDERLREARSIDAMEGTPDKLIANDFINIRL